MEQPEKCCKCGREGVAHAEHVDPTRAMPWYCRGHGTEAGLEVPAKPVVEEVDEISEEEEILLKKIFGEKD